MWYYMLNNQQVGPVDENEIKKQIEAGAINHNTMVWTAGLPNWLPVGQSSLASLMGSVPPLYVPHYSIENPKVKNLRSIFTWFWFHWLLAYFSCY